MRTNYHSIMSDLPERVDHNTTIVLDTETTGLHKLNDVPFMLLLAIDNDYFALKWSPNVAWWLNKNLDKAGIVICHNAKYDWHMMRNGGVDANVLYNTNVYCTMVVEALINEHRLSYSLDNLGMEYFDQGKLDELLYERIAATYGGKPDKKQMANVSKFAELSQENWVIVADYGMQDIDLTRMLYFHQGPEIRKQNLETVVTLEMNVLKALVEVEARGVLVDVKRVERVTKELTERQKAVQDRIVQEVGWMVNPRSPLEMEKAFRKLGIPIKQSAKGKPTFAKDALEQLSDFPFIKMLQESRNIKTMMDTFIGGSIGKNITPNNRIHTNFNQTRNGDSGTMTGRLSSTEPNLQQIPKRDGELAPLIRSLFYPGPGRSWIANDWEQFEFRVFAHYVKDLDLTERYEKDPHTDFHTALAEMTGKPRDKAKRINLGLVFGMGEGKLAKELGLPYTTEIKHGKEMLIAGSEAKALFEEYHSRFPKAKAFLQEASQLARSRGYVRTITGRRIRFPGGEFVHKAGGLIFQGTSADFMKIKLVELNNEFRNTDVEFVLIVHDEFCLTAPKNKAEQVAARVKEITEHIPQLRIPILADAGIGPTWWEAH